MPQRRGPNWWSRNWNWFVPTLFFVIFVLPAAACGSVVYVVMSSLKNSDVARESLSRARTNQAVVEKLGSPIQMGRWATGSVNVNNENGVALLVIPISGPKGKATLTVSAHKRSGEWRYEEMQVMVEGGGRVNLLTESEQKDRQLQLPSDSPAPEPSSN
jgi:hypothetical protein